MRIGLVMVLLLGGCLPAAVPRLVRDDAGIFSVETKAAAEARLRAVAVAVNGARLFPSRLGCPSGDSNTAII